ncbi:hypothetical protein ACFSTI_30085 [Rhizorhabdus histidinilytica]
MTGKQLSLVDGEGHGTGRLVLVLKPMPTRVTADWMAQQWRDDKRIKKKLGSYPSMSLSKAREIFNRDFAERIQKGRSIKIAGDTRPGTVADLFEAYVAYLKAGESRPGRRRKRASTRSPIRSGATGLPATSSPMRSRRSSAPSTSAVSVQWRIMYAAISARPLAGA